MQRKNRCDVYNELWVKMYVECMVTYDKDLDISIKESKKEIFTSGSLRFWWRVIYWCHMGLYCVFTGMNYAYKGCMWIHE